MDACACGHDRDKCLRILTGCRYFLMGRKAGPITGNFRFIPPPPTPRPPVKIVSGRTPA